MLALLSMVLSMGFLLHKKDSWVLFVQILLVLSFLVSFFWGQTGGFHFCSQLGSFLLDGMSLSLIILSFWVTILMVLASWVINKKSVSNILFLLSCFSLLFILLLCFSVKSVLKFYILFEVSLIPTFYLIMKWGYQPERLQASLYMLLYTICASLPFLVTMMFFLNQGLNLDMKSFFPIGSFSYENFCWSFFLMLAFFVKMPLYFTHLWLPKAHVEAPVAGSMILAGILLKLGSYGLVRVCKMWFVYLFKFSELFITVSLVGGVMTSVICMSQSDLKSLIAYSSIGHMGMLTAGILGASFIGILGAVIIMVAHGLCSSGMFFLVNSFYKNSSSRSVFLNKGILIAFPVLTMLAFLLFSCNMAAPPSINLGGELMISMGVLSFSKLSAVNIILLTFLAGGYSIYSYVLVAHGALLKSSSSWKELQMSDLKCAFLHFYPIWLLVLNLKLFV